MTKKTLNNWEKEAQEWMDKLDILGITILNNIVYHKLLSQRKEIVEEIREKLKWDVSSVYYTNPSDSKRYLVYNASHVHKILSDIEKEQRERLNKLLK